MMAVNIRRQGGAAIMTIPSDVLKVLGLKVGSEVMLDVAEGDLIVRPVRVEKKRYTLEELLHGITPEVIEAMRTEMKWADEGGPVGREML